jgi:hypothetical protein
MKDLQSILKPQGASSHPTYGPTQARPNPTWGPYSPTARAELDTLLGGGGTFGNTGRGTDIKAREIHAALDSSAVKKQTVQDRMDQLRIALREQGVTPETMTQEQWRAVKDKINPLIFAAPLMAGGTAAGLSAKDRMAQMMMTGEPY